MSRTKAVAAFGQHLRSSANVENTFCKEHSMVSAVWYRLEGPCRLSEPLRLGQQGDRQSLQDGQNAWIIKHSTWAIET